MSGMNAEVHRGNQLAHACRLRSSRSLQRAEVIQCKMYPGMSGSLRSERRDSQSGFLISNVEKRKMLMKADGVVSDIA
jgi:hypothetical protein